MKSHAQAADQVAADLAAEGAEQDDWLAAGEHSDVPGRKLRDASPRSTAARIAGA